MRTAAGGGVFHCMSCRELTRLTVRRLVLALALSAVTAVSVFPAAAQRSDQPPEAVRRLLKESQKLVRKGDLIQAEKLLRQAVDIDQSRSEARVELGLVLTKQRRYNEAYELVFPIAKAEPKNARAYSVLGTTLLGAGRFQEARLVLYSALQMDRGQHLAWAGFGMLEFYENNINQSLDNLGEAVFRDNDEPDYIFAYAQVSARAERFREAANAYERFLAISDSGDKDRRARIKGLITFLRFLGQNSALYMSAGRESTTVPFELVGNRPVIRLRLNGRPEPLRFVLDTGSGITVISEDTARQLKIRPVAQGGHARGIGGDGRFAIVYGLLRSVHIGDVELRNVPVYLRKFHQDQTNRVDGYIGLALISKFLTTIDYGSLTFALTRREADTREFRETRGESLPLRLTSSGFLSGEVQVEGIGGPLNFIVDTGASISVISERVARDEAVSKFENNERYRVIGSAGIADDVRTFLLPRISFGQHTRKDIMAVALDLDLINEASGFEQAGILGGNFLRNYRLTFDFKDSKVSFVQVRPDKD
jgi:tetratricopeptide (TPR) repeat protein